MLERSAAKLDRRRLVRARPSTHTARSLPVRRVVDAADEVPRERAPVRPTPTPALQRHSVSRAWWPAVSSITARASIARGGPPSSASVPRARDAGLLARPHLRAPVRAAAPRSPAASSSARSSSHAAVADAQAPGAPGARCAARARAGGAAAACARAARPSARGRSSAQKDWRAGPTATMRRARHQLLAEDPHVAPALQRRAPRETGALRRRRWRRVAGRRVAPAGRRAALCFGLLTDQSIYSRGSRRGRCGRSRGGCALMRVAAVQLNSSADPAANLAVAERLDARRGGRRRAADRTAREVDRDGLRAGSARGGRAAATARRSRGRARLARELRRGSRRRLDPRARARPARSSRTPPCTSTRTASCGPSTARCTCSTSRSAGASTASPSSSSRARRSCSRGPPRASRSGMSVCYDLRFPELYRILAVRGAR